MRLVHIAYARFDKHDKFNIGIIPVAINTQVDLIKVLQTLLPA